MTCNRENQGCKAGYVESSFDIIIEKGGIPIETKHPFNPDFSPATSICL